MPQLSVYRIFSLLFLLATATMLQAQTPPSPPIVSDFDWSADGARIAIGYSRWWENT